MRGCTLQLVIIVRIMIKIRIQILNARFDLSVSGAIVDKELLIKLE